MIGKQKAHAIAREERLTFGDLKVMIAAAATKNGMSSVNRQFTLARVCEIYAAALDGRPDVEVPKAWRPDPYSSSGAVKPSKNFMIVTNILRDCG